MKIFVWAVALSLFSTALSADLQMGARPAISTDVFSQSQVDILGGLPALQGADPVDVSMQPPADISAITEASAGTPVPLRPRARSPNLPRTRWQHMAGNALWTRTGLAALKAHGKPLVDLVPRDIADWCPAYVAADDAARRAFWVGFLSALAKHESTYKPWAVGGGGRWYGLLQILPRTARGYKCNAGTGDALKSGPANLSCAVRIMARTVPRDGVIYGKGGRGVAADWGPMRSAAKRREMAGWLKKQSYCKPVSITRPRARP